MLQEAFTYGLRVSSKFEESEALYGIQKHDTSESMKGLWWILELLPLGRLSYRDDRSETHVTYL